MNEQHIDHGDGKHFCPNCGNQLADGVNYCPICGTNIENGIINDNTNDNTTGELIVGAIAVVVLGVAIYYFKLYYDTMYTINGISTSKAPNFMSAGIIFLVIGLIIGIAAVSSLIRKLKK